MIVLWTFVTQAHNTCIEGISNYYYLIIHSTHINTHISITNTHISITNTLGNLAMLTDHLT